MPSHRSKRLSRKIEVLMLPAEHAQLLTLAQSYNLSMASLVRIALRDLYLKIQSATPTVSQPDPLLRSTAKDTPPVEFDPFWEQFRK